MTAMNEKNKNKKLLLYLYIVCFNIFSGFINNIIMPLVHPILLMEKKYLLLHDLDLLHFFFFIITLPTNVLMIL